MKKSTRILAFLMAFAMLIGSFSVMGSAYEAYKGDAIKGQYNDIDVPEFTTEQAASMALDEVDRMLAKEQIYLNIYVGELDLRSVNYTITSLDNLLTKVSSLLSLLGSASELTIASLKTDSGDPMQRSTANSSDGNVTDVKFITSLLDFLGDNAGIFEQYVNKSFNLGIMNGFVADFIFDVRQLAIGLVYSLTEEGKGFDALDDDFSEIPEKYTGESDGIINLAQLLLNEIVLGDWVKLDDYFDNPWKTVNVRYNFYDFKDADGNAISETAPDTANYDYYGYVHPDEWVTAALGGAVRVTEGAAAPAADYSAVDITGNVDGYTFIETLLQRAFNYILVPVLNNQTRHALREWCGVEYLDIYTRRTIQDETGAWVENPSYDPNYEGEAFDASDEATDNDGNVYNDIFNVNAYIGKATVPADSTLIANINDILGDFLGAAEGSTTGILKDAATPADECEPGAIDWSWEYGSNAYLFTNIANVARYVLQVTGRAMFVDYVEVPDASVLEEYTDQQIVAFVLRSIFNASVDWMFVPNDEENQTILGVCYSAVEQLAYQDIPQYTYDRPLVEEYDDIQDYYDAIIDQALNILLDVAVYNLNQSFDANPTEGKNAGEGLIPYSQEVNGTWEDTAVMVAEWAVEEYGPLLAIYNDLYSGGKTDGTITMENVWTDIDTILNSLIPIVGDGAWISTDISNNKFTTGDTAVAKAFLFDYVLKPVYTLDATNFSKIFDRNTTGTFATMNGVAIIADILDNVFDILFPNVFLNGATSVDAIVQNDVLGTMIYDLIKSLGTKTFDGKTNNVSITGRANDIATVAIPVVDMILGLSDEQEFEEIEIYLPGNIKSGEATTFSVYNGSSGINTGYTNASGTFSQDTLYTYTVSAVSAIAYHADGSSSNLSYSGIANNTKFAGGDSVDVTIAKDNLVNGDIVEFKVTYTVSGEEAGTTIGGTLSKTVYSYVGSVDKDDDELEKEITLSDGRSIKYESEIYLDAGDGLDDIESYGIRIQDNEAQKDYVGTDTNGNGKIDGDEGVAPTLTTATFGTVTNNDANNAFVATADAQTANLSGQDGLYFLNPFKLAQKADGTYYERYKETYEVDENGETVLDSNGDPVVASTNGGVEDGDYTVIIPVTVGSETQNVEVTIHLYNSYGLKGQFNSAVSQNRQLSEYDDDTAVQVLWGNYVAALKNAAKLALTPKDGDSFQTFIGKYDDSDDYENYYERESVALESAIEALEEYAAVTGVSGIKNVIANHDGYNYEVRTYEYDGVTYYYKVDIEYYEDGYTFFGERDYIPHLYDRYRDARKAGQKLIDTQEIYIKAPFSDVDIYGEDYVPSDDEVIEFNNSIAAANEKMANPTIIGSTEAAYAQHMLELTSSRLIRLVANKSKLDLMIENCTGTDPLGNTIDLSTGSSKYTEESWTDYTNALTFAQSVSAEEAEDALGEATDLTPTKVNIAMSNLVESWKRLVYSIDFTDLDEEIALSEATAALGYDQTVYTSESYAAFMEAYNAAVNVDRNMAANEDNEKEVDAIRTALETARNSLESAASAEPTWSLVTATPSAYASSFVDKYKTLTFTPILVSSNTSLKHQTSYFKTPLASDGTTVVDDFIIGIGFNLSEAAAKAIIDESSLNNCTVSVTPYQKKYSTGSLIQIIGNDGTVLKTYQLIHYSDLKIDGRSNTSDTAELVSFISNGASYKTDYTLCAKWAASDLTFDQRVNTKDIGQMKSYMGGSITLDQANQNSITL